MAQRLTSNWLLECCCCYTRQKPVRASMTGSGDANEMAERRKSLQPIVESRTPSIDSSKSRNNMELSMEEIVLAKPDCGVSKDDEDVTENEEASLTDHKDDSIDTSDFRSKSSSGSTLSGMKRMIGSLPVLPRKEKKQLSSNDEKKAPESDSEIGYPTNVFVKCSRRHEQQKVPMNIPELIIS